MSEESHFEVRRAREMLERWRERAARQQAKKAKEHRPTFDEEQHQKDIGYLLLVIKNLESGYYARQSTAAPPMRARDDLGYFIERARTDETRAILRRQWQEIHPDIEPPHGRAVTCPCGQIRAITIAFRCLYCGVFYCATCAEIHFGMTQQQHDQIPSS